MSAAGRIRKIIKGLLTLLCCALMAANPEKGYYFVVVILDIMLLIYGFRMLIYYFQMARFTVGGIATLYKSIIVLDFGMFAFALESTPQKLVMLYLIIVLTVSGIINIIDAMGAKKLEAGSWKYQFIYGLVIILMGIACLFCLDSTQIVTFVFCIGMIHYAISEISSAFRKTAAVCSP